MNSTAFEGFELVEGARPIFAQEAGEGSVGEKFTVGLAGGAIVGFVGSVADALDGGAAAGAGKAIAAVGGHALAEGGDLLGECAEGLGAQPAGPFDEGFARGGVELRDVGGREFLGERSEERRVGKEG